MIRIHNLRLRLVDLLNLPSLVEEEVIYALGAGTRVYLEHALAQRVRGGISRSCSDNSLLGQPTGDGNDPVDEIREGDMGRWPSFHSCALVRSGA